jgi:hypothetical protein
MGIAMLELANSSIAPLCGGKAAHARFQPPTLWKEESK